MNCDKIVHQWGILHQITVSGGFEKCFKAAAFGVH